MTMPSQELSHVSTLSTYIQSHPALPSHSSYQHTLAVQVQHNLQYQHDWTSLRIHTHSPLTQKPLPRPLISGLPPHRIYVHPDDQVEELKDRLANADVKVELEWVLPTHLQEKWSLKRFAEVFDSIGEEPTKDEHVPEDSSSRGKHEEEAYRTKKRRGGKRLLLATIGDDSTVVYYIVHEGIVKPRQN